MDHFLMDAKKVKEVAQNLILAGTITTRTT